jgi:AcrR family transcriptional regulator
MDERARTIASAGLAVIARYGVRKVKVDDVAREAGVSRQTIYNAFPNRKAILAAIVHLHWESKWKAIDAACVGLSELSDKLDVLLQKMVIEPWETMQVMPHAEDLEIELVSGLRDDIRSVQVDSVRYLESFFAPYAAGLETRGLTPHGLADFIHRSIFGLQMSTTTREQVNLLVTTMKALLHCVAQSPEPSACTSGMGQTSADSPIHP